MRKNLFKSLLMGLLCCFWGTMSAEANLIFNGSFEDSSYTDADYADYQGDKVPYFKDLFASDTGLYYWQIGGNGVGLVYKLWQAADGTKSIDLSAAGAGSISQSFLTTIDQQYEVTFAMAGNPQGGNVIKDLKVTVGSVERFFQFDTTGYTESNMGWQTVSFIFTANASEATLTFTGLEASPYGPAIDNLNVKAAVPEPATMLLLASGLVGIAAFRRKLKN